MAAGGTRIGRLPGFRVFLGKSHDVAVERLVQQVVQSDPAAAVKWLDGITDETVWQSAAQSMADEWYQSDPGAAQKWVAQSQLPDEFKTNFAKQKP